MSDSIETVLAGIWRESAEESSTDALTHTAPVLLHAEAGALAWRRIRNSALRSHPIATELQQVYRYNTLQSAIHEHNILDALSIFHEAGIDPVLIKGWAIARLYPEPGLRPYSDIDLCIHPDQYSAAQRILRNSAARHLPIDLHNGLNGLDDRSFDVFYHRSRGVPLGDRQVRVLSPEDHLRILCFHLLRHGAWRPLWLCDVAVAVENRPDDFDWDRCLGQGRRAQWVACAIGLAHRLLGARIADTPLANAADDLPDWMIRHIIRQWERPVTELRGSNKHRAPMATYLSSPFAAFKDLSSRWPDPIAATISLGAPLNSLPRLPFQLANVLIRTGFLLTEVKASIFRRHETIDDINTSKQLSPHSIGALPLPNGD